MSDRSTNCQLRAARLVDALYTMGWRPLKDPDVPIKGVLVNRRDAGSEYALLRKMIAEQLLDLARAVSRGEI